MTNNMTNIYSLKGKVVGEIKLPEVFKTQYRPDLIQRAVVAMQANRRQVYGTDPLAGLRTTAEYFGSRHHTYRMTINKEQARLPKEKPGGGGLGKTRRIPQSVGGRRAHPPKNKDWVKKVNNKEYLFALKSAISATSNPELVQERGHKIAIEEKSIPLIVEDNLESLSKTKEVVEVLNALGLDKDIERAQEKKVRAGRGTMRGRKYRKKKSVLIVVNEDNGILESAQNIPGVDIAKLDDLDVELLAPGTHAGRLTVWTKSAIENIDKNLEKW
jgi:large subunit ribosomal protein L4e